ncbi:RnfH family protein [Thiothrix lacustris]|jgi:hypothetical protein|uniref:UPF0125 protein RCF98_04815 n=1 Tax=Thiothrix lacustris TaxID=525917 RepID=A0ABY9MT31_9GAMM|nr:RnfH family protein [Thiothrix lacustris]WML91663.1 RnfH family protein [Thiothrix lacustris]WMP16478.1 RnfH family protein [Thiothrix lacustris]
MATTDNIRIEVVYPLPHEQLIMTAQVPDGASIREGIQASGILEHYPELTLDTLEAGIFGKLAKLDAPLRERDRIEIYRPLIADPKAVRKQRAAEGKNMKKGGGDADSAEDS